MQVCFMSFVSCGKHNPSHLSQSCNRTRDGARSLFLRWLSEEPFLPPISSNGTEFCGLWWIAIIDSCILSTIGWCPYEHWSPNYCYTSWSVLHRVPLCAKRQLQVQETFNSFFFSVIKKKNSNATSIVHQLWNDMIPWYSLICVLVHLKAGF